MARHPGKPVQAILPNARMSYVVTLLNRMAPIPHIPLEGTSISLDISGVAGFFGGDVAVTFDVALPGYFAKLLNHKTLKNEVEKYRLSSRRREQKRWLPGLPGIEVQDKGAAFCLISSH